MGDGKGGIGKEWEQYCHQSPPKNNWENAIA
jgi:hypothetical protein